MSYEQSYKITKNIRKNKFSYYIYNTYNNILYFILFILL